MDIFLGCIALIFIPEIIAKNRWEAICKSDSGTTIYRKINVQGFYTQISTIDSIKERLATGYKFVEIDSPNIELGRYKIYDSSNINNDGEFKNSLISEYLVYNRREKANNGYENAETVIQNRQGENIAVTRKIYYYGSSLYRKFRSLFGPQSSQDYLEGCLENINIGDLVMQAIPPIK